MELLKAYRTTKIIEAIENYSLSGDTNVTLHEYRSSPETQYFYSVESFWKTVLSDTKSLFNKNISLEWNFISDWVPRIPGLYWTNESKELRAKGFRESYSVGDFRIELLPTGKSKMVSGGVGTIRFPTDENGCWLYCLCSDRDASQGIPVLIYPEIMEYFGIKPGDSIKIKDAKWLPMSFSWAQRFSSTKNIPKGFLVIQHVDQIEYEKSNIRLVYSPYTIMEYQLNDALLYDFVFVNVDDKNEEFRERIEKFFLDYANKEGRNGKYLINPDVSKPLFEAQYISPSDMKQPSEKAKLDLLYKRIRKAEFTKTTLNKLIEVLPHYYASSASVKRLAKNVGVSPAIFQEDNTASMSAQLINFCADANTIEELTDRMIVEYPQIFNLS